jgi:hypothetical protein
VLLKREAKRLGVEKRSVPAREIFDQWSCLCGHMNHTDLVPEDSARV